MKQVIPIFLCIAFAIGCADKPKGARITMIRGLASVISAGKSEPAAVGQVVQANDEIITEKDSIVDLQIANGGAFRVAENSKVKINSLGEESEMNLEKGGLLVGLQKLKGKESFTVRTPTALAGVRGTSFSISAERSTIAVLTGSVEVKKGETTVEVPELKEVRTTAEKLETKSLSRASAEELTSIGEIEGISEVEGFDEIQKNLSLVVLDIEKETLGNGKQIQPREAQEKK
ncbi:MAG: FecR family protein [Spirochaetia bacterium]|nr:FecR family protein [Spirochaetia bacterium]